VITVFLNGARHTHDVFVGKTAKGACEIVTGGGPSSTRWSDGGA
jgi:hypothetical protein